MIEILVVMGIISVIGAFIGFNIRRALISQRFKSEVALVVDQMRLAQDLMLILNTDAHVKFTGEEDGLLVWLDVEDKLSKNWERIVERDPYKLKEIHSISFEDELEYPSKEEELDIRFMSGGGMMSKGSIMLSTHENPDEEGAEKRWICLRGYPHSIQSSTKDLCEEPEPPLDQLTELTMIEVQDSEAM